MCKNVIYEDAVHCLTTVCMLHDSRRKLDNCSSETSHKNKWKLDLIRHRDELGDPAVGSAKGTVVVSGNLG